MDVLKLVSKDPSELSIHPAAKPMPEWAKDDERFIALVEDIRDRGIDQPLLIDKENRIVDGRHRWRSAKQLQLPEVMCRIVSEEEVASIILHSLLQRRHFTRGALAYLAFPLLSTAHQEAQKRRLIMLRKGDKAPSFTERTTGKTVEEFANNLGFGRTLFYQARDLHDRFAELPKFKPEFEQKLLDGEIGLGACLAGIAGKEKTDGKARIDKPQLELFQDVLGTFKTRWVYWSKFNTEERAVVRKDIIETVNAMPADLREEWEKALKAAKKEEK